MKLNWLWKWAWGLVLIISGPVLSAQNFIETGNFANACGWDFFGRGACSSAYFSPSAGNSFIWTSQALSAGNCYFRLFTDWGGSQQRHEPNVSTLLAFNTEYALASNWGTANAHFINAGNTAWNYVFKTPNGDGINQTPQVLIFEIQGAVESILSVSQNPVLVNAGNSVTVSAVVSGLGALPAGESIYLRYSDDGFSTSTVVEMTYSGSGQTYTAIIPGGVNAMGVTVEYYCFTSGPGLFIPGTKADWYTINLNNNGGTNYSYSVSNIWTTSAGGSGLWSDPLSWDPGTIPPVGVSVWIEDNLILDMDAEISSMTILAGITFTSDDGAGRTLRIQANGNLTNNGALNSPGGQFVFLGNAILSGSLPFHSVFLAGGVDFGASATVSDTLKLLAGGYVSLQAPSLLTGSVLNYATGDPIGSPYGRGLEWNSPQHVAITHGTWVDWPNGNNLAPLSLIGDLHVVNGGLHWQNVERPLSVGGNVLIESNGTLEMSTLVGGDLYVAGNLTNLGVFNGNNRTVKFNGTNTQVIEGSFIGSNRFHYLDIDNANGLIPDTDIEVEDTLRFFNGLIHLNNHHLTFTETGITSTVPAYAPKVSSMIVTLGSGEVRKVYPGVGAFTFPVGDTSGTHEYSPCTIQFTSGTFAPGAYLGVKVTDLKHPLNPSTNHYLTRYWEVEESGITGFAYNCSFSYTDADVYGNESNILGLKSDDGGLTWLNLPAVNAAANEVYEYGLTNFSIFTGGESALLGVEWAYFQGTPINDWVQLDWATSLEWNAREFVVERSLDGLSYTDMISVPALGGNQMPNNYQAFDENPQKGWNWYRLRQIDLNGDQSWSPSIQVFFDGNGQLRPGDFIPFASQGYIYAQISGSEPQDWTVEVLDLAGRRIALTAVHSQAGQQSYPLAPVSLGPGNILLVRASNGQAILNQKIVIH